MYEILHDSELWEDAIDELKEMPLKEKILLYSRALYPYRKGELTLEDKIDILMKLPNQGEILANILTEREIEVVNFLDEGLKYEDICIEIGLANKSSVVQILNRIRRKIEANL